MPEVLKMIWGHQGTYTNTFGGVLNTFRIFIFFTSEKISLTIPKRDFFPMEKEERLSPPTHFQPGSHNL